MADLSADCGLNARTPYRASILLEQLKDDLPESRVSLGWLFEYARLKSPETLILILAAVGVIPGIATLVGILLVFLAPALVFEYELRALPPFVAARGLSSSHLVRMIERALPYLKWSETFVRRQDTALAAILRPFAMAAIFLLSCTLLVPLPLSNVLPSLAIGFVAFASLEADALLLSFSLATAALSLAITSATIWASIGLAGSLWG
jgi:hypothetical protein